MATELRFACTLPAPPRVVWERAVAVSGANDELWPLAKMTLPIQLDSHTPPGEVVGRQLHTWTLAFGFLPVDRRTMQIEVFEEGRFRECSRGLLQGRMCHERTAVGAEDDSTILTDILVFESRGRLADAILQRGVTMTFRRRHRRLRGHFERELEKRDGA